MLVMAGNLIVFAIIICIICTVDLSSVTLDESTEKLLYEVVEDSVAEEKPEEGAEGPAEESENGTEGSDGDVMPDIMDFDPQPEPVGKVEPAAKESAGSVKTNGAGESDFKDLNDVASSAGFNVESCVGGTIDAEALRAQWEGNDGSVGMSADFDEDFDTDDVMEDIYNAR